MFRPRPTGAPQRSCTTPRSTKGGALIIALCATIPLLIAAGTLLITVTQGRRATETTVALAQARDASASGAQDALAQLTTNPNYRGSYQLALNGPLATVSVSAWGTDGIDNDADGAVDDAAEEPFVEIVSTGTTNIAFDPYGFEIARPSRHARSITEAIVQTTDLDIVVDQAVYLDDSMAPFVFNNTQFLIDGDDKNLDDTAGPNAALPGIGTAGDTTDVTAQLGAGQDACVVGAGGTPSVAKVADIDLAAQVPTLAALATQTWGGPSDTFNGSIGDRSTMTPVIAYAKGNLTLDASTSGCGILIVDGDLEIDDSFDFAGFIYVAGNVTFGSNGGDKLLHGALFSAGGIDGPDPTFGGMVKLQYCSEALKTVSTRLAGSIALVSWMQR
jgi:hypothetical protein